MMFFGSCTRLIFEISFIKGVRILLGRKMPFEWVMFKNWGCFKVENEQFHENSRRMM